MSALRISLAFPALAAAFLVVGIFFEALLMLRVTGGVTVGDALIMASAALLMALALQGRTRIWLPAWLLLAVPLIAAGPLLHALFGDWFDRADLVMAIELTFCAIVLPAVIASQAADRRLARRLVLAWIAGNIVGAAVAYLQFHWFDLGPLQRWVVWNSGRVAGMTPNPNTLGASLALVAPMCVAFAADTRRLLPMALWTIAAIGCVHVIDLTGSRTAIVSGALGCAAVVVLFAARTRAVELPLRIIQLIVAVGLVVAAWELRSGYHDSAIERLLGRSVSAEISAYFRNALHRASLEAIGAAPFLGNGYGSMAHAAHNVPMALIQGGGLAGFAGFVLAQAGLLLAAVRLYLQSRDDLASRGFVIGLLGVWCAWLALGIYDVSILNRNAYVPFGIGVLWWVAGRGGHAVPARPVGRARAHAA